ncbi:MAG: DegT/DnrJ/EryC1/StrS family aminotransferase, partial [Burkholderiaceae bacterium]
RVIRSGAHIGGEEVECLESELASYLGVSDVITVNSGTDALFLTLKALDIGHGCEVIVPTFTFVASVSTIVHAGANPVFVDCAPDSFLLDIEAIEALISPRTKAILAVHLFGQAVNMTQLLCLAGRYSLCVIEDVAQAFGAQHDGVPLGSLGTAGAFSFYPTKTLGALGDGGAIATNDVGLALRLRRLRNHGRVTQTQYQEVGYNSRLDALQAAFLRAKLPCVADGNAQRHRIADLYCELLSGLPLKLPVPEAVLTHAYGLFVMALPQRDALQAYLRQENIGTAVYYREACDQMDMFAAYVGGQTFPVAHQWAATVLALPSYPALSDVAVHRVCHAIRSWFVLNGL